MSRYTIDHACVSDTGVVRSINQDNFICDGLYMDPSDPAPDFPLWGRTDNSDFRLYGVFDGMGGEDCGEVAAFIAADEAAHFMPGNDAVSSLRELCFNANKRICRYIEDHDDVFSTGTTAAMVAFTTENIVICNIGDTKIFTLSDGIFRQISTDHLMFAPYGTKPPLSQNLGIPETELIIDPFTDEFSYRDGDMYLICSDGLTDMMKAYEIEEILTRPDTPLKDKAAMLVDTAKERGGKDNITVILLVTCKA